MWSAPFRRTLATLYFQSYLSVMDAGFVVYCIGILSILVGLFKLFLFCIFGIRTAALNAATQHAIDRKLENGVS